MVKRGHHISLPSERLLGLLGVSEGRECGEVAVQAMPQYCSYSQSSFLKLYMLSWSTKHYIASIQRRSASTRGS